AGLAGFAAYLDQGGNRAQVVQTIVASPEYRTRVVRELYATYLHREADAAGLEGFVGFLGAGGTVEQVQAALAASPEYARRQGGGAAGSLGARDGDVLAGAPAAAGRAGFGQGLAGGASRAAVAAAVFASPEYQARLVSDLFQRFLDRDAEGAGRDGFV